MACLQQEPQAHAQALQGATDTPAVPPNYLQNGAPGLPPNTSQCLPSPHATATVTAVQVCVYG